MLQLGYYNGVYGPLESMTIPMTDRVCYFGDGIYDATYAKNGHIFTLSEHLDRFFRSAALLKIPIHHTKIELAEILYKMLKKVDGDEQFVYWQLTRGTEVRNHTFSKSMQPNLWIMIKPGTLKDVDIPIRILTKNDTRYLHCNVKTLNLIPNILAAEEAESVGCYECAFVRDGFVTECAHSNISILTKGMLKTAPADHRILAGVCRAHLIQACKKIGIKVTEEAFTREEMLTADEILVTSAGSLGLRVCEIDGIACGMNHRTVVSVLQGLLKKEFEDETSR